MENKYTLITGCFDIIHAGHIQLIEFAKTKFPRHTLIIAIDSNDRVKKAKGDSRPINDLLDRMYVVESIKGVDCSIPFDSEEALIEICEDYKPIRIVGSDYKGINIVGKEHCSAIVYFDRIVGYSTTNIIGKINETSSLNC